MGQKARFQETLRKLAMIDEGFVEGEALVGLGQVAASALDPRTVALLRVGASVAIGSSAVCLEWSAGRALAAGASEDEIADVLLAVLPVAGLGRVVSGAPDLAAALGYDVWAELEKPAARLRVRIKPGDRVASLTALPPRPAADISPDGTKSRREP